MLLFNPIIWNIQQMKTLLRAMLLHQSLQQLLIALTHQPSLPSVRTPSGGAIDGIIKDGEAQVLEVDPDLVCAASQGQTADNTGFPVEAQSVEDGSALLSLRVDSAQADFKGHDQDGLLADQLSLRKLPLHAAHILLFQLFESTNKRERFVKNI